MSGKQRISIWDNLKCFLMLSVVLGHFVNQYSDSSFMRSMMGRPMTGGSNVPILSILASPV